MKDEKRIKYGWIGIVLFATITGIFASGYTYYLFSIIINLFEMDLYLIIGTTVIFFVVFSVSWIVITIAMWIDIGIIEN